MEQIAPSRVRFGRFELNLHSGELRAELPDGGEGLLLREQPFRILKMLLERRGKIVTREEIRRSLWPNDTIVNFDHSINVAIGILRRALSDSADDPKYIETLARRGYRLLVEVEMLQSAAEQPLVERPAKEGLPSRNDIIGRKVSHYRVLEAIGVGGMGVVYSAEDLRLGRRVALKFLPAEVAGDPTTLLRFEREAQTASTLNHPNICTVYEVEEQDDQPFIVMELLEGVSLSHQLAASVARSMPAARIIQIALQVCDGLQAAHDKNIIHRDIKPANIFLTLSGPVKILDFGLAKLIDRDELVLVATRPSSPEDIALDLVDGTGSKAMRASLTVAGTKIGTASYMSPEQVRGEPLDARTDIFSLGLVIYEAVTGRRAFAGESETVVHRAILSEALTSARRVNSSVPRALDTVIARALEKDRTRRYSSVIEMRQALESMQEKAESMPSRRRLGAVAASVLVLASAGAGLYRVFHPRIALSRGDTVVFATTNQTNDPVFDDALAATIYFGLQQTPYIHVLQSVKLHETMSELHIADEAKITPDVGRQVCLRTKSRMVIAASIAEEGNNFHVVLKGLDCGSGAVIATVERDIASRAVVIRDVGQVLVELRGKLGEPASSTASFNKPLDKALSASPEALQLLMEGYRHLLVVNFGATMADMQRAVAVDPHLAMAYVVMAGVEQAMGQRALAVAAATRAFTLRDRVTQPVQFQIDDVYYAVATGEQGKNLSVLSKWVQLYPDDFIAHSNFFRALFTVGKLDSALAEARESVRLFPSPWSYDQLAYADIMTNRFDEAATTIADAEARNFDNPELRNQKYMLAFITRNSSAMQEQSHWAVGKPHIDHAFLFARATVEGFYGQFADQARITSSAIALADKYGDSSSSAEYNGLMALDRAEVGDLENARNLAAQSLTMVQNANTLPTLALALARAGDAAEAQRSVDQLNRESPLDTIVQDYYLPSIRASIMLRAQDPHGALDVLASTTDYELASPDAFSGLYPAYLRGQAYLQMGKGHLASVEFQKLLDHPGLTGRDVTGALARLQVARAHRMEGDVDAAQRSYEDFLTLWKDADPTLSIYRQAKAEYAALRTRR